MLKAKVGLDWFSKFDFYVITSHIDSLLYPKSTTPGERVSLLLSKAQTGDYELADAFMQFEITFFCAFTVSRLQKQPHLQVV